MDFQFSPDKATKTTKTVLIADEEPEVRDALSVAVRRWAQEEQRNLDTIMVENGQRAVDYIKQVKKQNSPPFLIILDLRMPNINGLETARLINKLCPEIPIIITASYDEIDEQLIQEADDFANQNSHIGFIVRTKSSPLLKVALEFEIRKLFSLQQEYEEENINLFFNLKGRLSNLLIKAF
ncbi:response regulator [Rivularia sp. PCC 7116]|uniref:response regulator n=1 Tax=Rivularia sp. PCC 7116 TaxID=373994 RepID=UPI0005C7CE98|nr:response regulator [Rivularia sp. PCC 7116]